MVIRQKNMGIACEDKTGEQKNMGIVCEVLDRRT